METMPQVADCLERFQRGDRDGAFFGLLEMEHGIVPDLIARFRGEPDRRVREFLVEVIWQHRQPSAIPFLGEVLRDSEPAVWRQALDGLATLGSPAALEVLREARMQQESAVLRDWLDEAIERVESDIRRA